MTFFICRQVNDLRPADLNSIAWRMIPFYNKNHHHTNEKNIGPTNYSTL